MTAQYLGPRQRAVLTYLADCGPTSIVALAQHFADTQGRDYDDDPVAFRAIARDTTRSLFCHGLVAPLETGKTGSWLFTYGTWRLTAAGLPHVPTPEP